MKLVLDPLRSLTIISDRHDGLVKGVPIAFPLSKHVWCYYHLKNNVRTQIRKKKEDYAQAMKIFQDCFYSSTTQGFDDGMAKLLELGCNCLYEYLDALPKEKWSNAYCQGCRFGDMCSNVAESFNSMIREEKSLPISTLVDRIRLKIMVLMDKRRDKGLNGPKYQRPVCPKIEKWIENAKQDGKTWRVVKSGDLVYEVIEKVSHLVDLNTFQCSCREWYTKQFPCAHAIMCMVESKISVYDYIMPVWSTATFRATYSQSIRPIPDEERPAFVAAVVAGAGAIGPPDVDGKKLGRPKKKRIPNIGSTRYTRKIQCGKCGKRSRHNRTTCTNSPAKKQKLLTSS